MAKNKHSQPPFVVVNHYMIQAYYADIENVHEFGFHIIAEAKGGSFEKRKANAEFIVKACNSYYKEVSDGGKS